MSRPGHQLYVMDVPLPSRVGQTRSLFKLEGPRSMTINAEGTKTEAAVRERARKRAASLSYATGFGNEHSSEALVGALPVGRNMPQRPAYGLYTELLSETAFTETRQNTRRTWL